MVSVMDMALSTTNNYWNLLKFLSDDIKLALIAKLSNSIVAKPVEKSVSASDFYGVWKDSDFDMSSDELVEGIKAGRRVKGTSRGVLPR